MPDSDESKITTFVSGLRREIQDIVELYEYFFHLASRWNHNF